MITAYNFSPGGSDHDLRNMYNILTVLDIQQISFKVESNMNFAPRRLFSSYSMRSRKILALLDGPEEGTFIGICFGVCKLLNHIVVAYKLYRN